MGVVVLGLLFSGSSNIRTSAAAVVCLKAPWLCEKLFPPQGHSTHHAPHLGLPGTPLACVLSWLSLHVSSTRVTSEKQSEQAAGVFCPGVQSYMQGTSVGMLHGVFLYLQCH